MRILRQSSRILAVIMAVMMALSLTVTDVHAAGKRKSKASGGTKITLSKVNSPKKISLGHTYSIHGKIKSGKRIQKVIIGVVDRKTGKWKQKYTAAKVNKLSYNIKKADLKIRFGKLKAGKYYYRIYVKLKGRKTKRVLNKKFTVVDNRAKTVKISSKDAASAAASEAADKAKASTNKAASQTDPELVDYVEPVTGETSSSGTTQTASDSGTTNTSTANDTSSQTKASDIPKAVTNSVKLSFKGCNAPSTYKVGKEFTPKGIVSASSTIRKVEVGIVFAPTNKWTDYKYTHSANSTSFDLSLAADKLRFDKLPAGEYRYRMYLHTEDGIVIAFNKEFKVKPSGKPAAAVKWAVDIANNDEFSYGKKPYTSRLGCYFCGTNQKKKPKGYEKTYVCLTFLGAAYAHGAGDPDILWACENSKMTMYSNNDNFKKFSCWMKIGLAKDLTVKDLLPGDVIVEWSASNGDGHVWMYVGDNKYVDAEGIKDCWGPASIAVRDGASSKLARVARGRSQNYVMRYIH